MTSILAVDGALFRIFKTQVDGAGSVVCCWLIRLIERIPYRERRHPWHDAGHMRWEILEEEDSQVSDVSCECYEVVKSSSINPTETNLI